MGQADAVDGIVDVGGVVGDGHLLHPRADFHKERYGGDADHAARIAQCVQHLIIHVARHVRQGPDTGMGRDHWRAR